MDAEWHSFSCFSQNLDFGTKNNNRSTVSLIWCPSFLKSDLLHISLYWENIMLGKSTFIKNCDQKFWLHLRYTTNKKGFLDIFSGFMELYIPHHGARKKCREGLPNCSINCQTYLWKVILYEHKIYNLISILIGTYQRFSERPHKEREKPVNPVIAENVGVD